MLVLALAGALLAPADALAEKTLTLPRAAISVTLEHSGGLLVREELTYRFSGGFTGAFRDVPLAAGTQATDVQVSEGGRPFAPGGATAIGSTGPARSFGSVRLPQGLRIVWHFRQSDGERTFTVRYRLAGVVVAHDDTVEVPARIWGTQWERRVGSLNASVRAESGRTATNAWIEPAWLEHRVSIRRDEVTATLAGVPSRRGVLLRVLYPPETLASGAPFARHVRDRALPALVAREDAAQARAERERRELDDALHHPFLWILAAIGVALAPAAAVAAGAYWLFGRERRSSASHEYVSEPPDDLEAALVPSLLAQREIAGGAQLAATLFELVRRGRYTITGVAREQASVAGLRRREIDDVYLARTGKSNKLSRVEEPVADIFDVLTEDSPMALSLVRKTLKDLPGEDRGWFQARFEEFEAAVGAEARERAFWNNRGMKVKWAAVGWLLAGSAGFLIAGVVGLSDEPLVRTDLILTAVGVGLLLSAGVVELLPARVWRRRSEAMWESAERWEGFRRYLRDFPRLGEKPADSLPLWERYLIYGIAFGLADRVLAAARLHLPRYDESILGEADAGHIGGFFPSHFSADMDGAFGEGSGGGDGGGGGGGSGDGGGGGGW